MKSSLLTIALAVVCALSAACGNSGNTGKTTNNPPTLPIGREYAATIRWTSYGIPHILADDLGSATFGQGYAFAKLHPCVLGEQIVRVRGEASRYFGPGEGDVNISKDLAYRSLNLVGQAPGVYRKMSGEAISVIKGFVAGYNYRLSRERASDVPDACRNAPWRRAITPVELVAYGMNISMIGSVGASMRMIGQAQPPRPGKTTRALPGFELPPTEALASNGWAIGAERSASGRGLLVANPHFPWRGSLRFYESHLTVPGQLNAYGANLLGLPLVSIAFNEHLGWTHTFSSSRRFAIYRLKLVDGDPTRYHYGSETRAMTGKKVSIEVKRADGSVDTVERTLYSSHHGPILAGGFLSWTKQYAYAIRDAASPNNRFVDQYLSMLRAKNLDEFKAAMRTYHSTPFVNTIYADKAGNAFYVDGSRVPQLRSMGLSMWKMARSTMPAVKMAWENGVIALDGSMPMFEWQSQPGAPAPGIAPFTAAPQLTRRDFVFNANDSYWIANPAVPLVNDSPFYGDAQAPLSARSRLNLKILTERGAAGASGADGKFDAAELERAALSNRGMMAELLRDQVVSRCREGARRDRGLAPLCETLAGWDLRLDLDSAGAVLWRELLGTFGSGAYDGSLFATRFDPARPLETPSGLAPAPTKGDDPLLAKLHAAAKRLRALGIDPTKATLRQLQFTLKAGTRIPVHGGSEAEGTTNIVFYRKGLGGRDGKSVNPKTGLYTKGYPINYGTSFLMVLSFTEAGPKARAVMTYSAASDPRSPHFKDQTELFAKKQLRDVAFTEAQIKADPKLVVEKLRTTGEE